MKRVLPVLLLLTFLGADAQAPKPAGPASVWELPAAGSSGGPQMSLMDCLSQAHACAILAPALRAEADRQPWGLGNTWAQGAPPVMGPKSTDPRGCVTDYRWGSPQVICNQGLTTGTSGRFLGSSPLFAQAVTTVGQSTTPHAPAALSLQYSVYAGSRDFGPDDETYLESISNNMWTHSSGSQYLYVGNLNSFAPGDSIPFSTSAYSVGQGLAQNEGLEWRSRLGETGNVSEGTLNTKTCGTICTFSLTQTQGMKGAWGNDLALIDVTRGYNSGYISRLTTGSGHGTVTGAGTNWDATFGVTTAETKTTAAVSNASGGNRKANTFPQSNVTISLLSSSGFSTGQIACMFDSIDPSWQCAQVTAVPDSTHLTVDQVSYPLSNNSTIAAGGLTGYGFGMDADWVSAGNPNGYAINPDTSITGTIRQVYPIVSSAKGNTLVLYTSNGVNGGFNTRAYGAMGAGGEATVAVSGGVVTGCSAHGGSGYYLPQNPPQLVIAGITYATAPVIYASSAAWGGGLTGCSVASGGAGIRGTAVVTVTPANAYHIYPQARTLSVFNTATGALDGSAIRTTPAVGTFVPGDTLEQAHYFRIKVDGNPSLGVYTYQSGGQHSNLTIFTGGSFGNNDYEASISNLNDPALYQKYPLGTPYIPGRGQLTTPYGVVLAGPHRNGLQMRLPPYGGNGGSAMGAVVVGCGTREQCAGWNAGYPVLNVKNAGMGEDELGYNPATRTWSLTSGATGVNGGNSSCALNFGPQGLSMAGPGCAAHISRKSSMEEPRDRGARLVPAVAELRGAGAPGEGEDASLSGANVPAWLQYLGTGTDGANTDASGALGGEKFYTDFTVPYGKTVTVEGSQGGLVVHATGACTIAGNIVASGAQNGSNSNGVTGGSGGGGGGGAAEGSAGRSSYPAITATDYGAVTGGARGAVHGGDAGNGATMAGSLVRAMTNSGGGVDGLYLRGAGGGQGGNSGGGGGHGGGGVVLICASIHGSDGTYTGLIDASGEAGAPPVVDAAGAGGGGGGGVVILSSRAKVKVWPAVHTAGGPGALAKTPQGLAVGGSCTVQPRVVLGVTSGALTSCMVAQAGAGCGAGRGVQWRIAGSGNGGTITASWSGGALQSCTAQGGAGYTAAAYATAGAGGDGGNGWSATFQGW